MPIKIEQLSGESIICATVSEPFDPERDRPVMFAKFIQLRLAIQGDVALIVDVSDTTDNPDSFSHMVFALAEAAQGIREGRAVGIKRPPFVVFVGAGPIATLVAQAMEQEQYGGVRGQLCESHDEALALAREKLST